MRHLGDIGFDGWFMVQMGADDPMPGSCVRRHNLVKTLNYYTIP